MLDLLENAVRMAYHALCTVLLLAWQPIHFIFSSELFFGKLHIPEVPSIAEMKATLKEEGYGDDAGTLRLELQHIIDSRQRTFHSIKRRRRILGVLIITLMLLAFILFCVVYFRTQKNKSKGYLLYELRAEIMRLATLALDFDTDFKTIAYKQNHCLSNPLGPYFTRFRLSICNRSILKESIESRIAPNLDSYNKLMEIDSEELRRDIAETARLKAQREARMAMAGN
ncbi:hypothetical protein TWF506_004620 [Arthrobotrys conoides]|uniref:Uncharacterized protein n=1 Tax=Arthrobotrys conoides TaxID=74498 RepID=A0AAN8NF24_9PEZI